MGRIKQKFINFAARIFFSITGSALSQEEILAPEGRAALTPGMDELLCRAAEEGAVLLANDGTLPLTGRAAVFGRVQTDTFYTGYGSGGNVMKPYRVSILEGMRSRGLVDEELAASYLRWAEEHPVDHGSWGEWPRFYPEMPLPREMVASAAARTETAVVVLGRAAGEDRESELARGSFYLTDEEEEMLRLVTAAFKRTVVVLNLGSIIDPGFLTRYPVSAALLIWQGGMEAGNACARLLCGEANPCGKLPDTVARRYEAYPSAPNFGNAAFNEYREDVYVGYRWFESFDRESVLFPFGFGLSYTTFSVCVEQISMQRVAFSVQNTGARRGREVVQLYVQKPCGNQGAPARELIGFYKTPPLSPGEKVSAAIAFSRRELCIYDEERSRYVMQAGEYALYLGCDVRSAQPVLRFSLRGEVCVEQLSRMAAPRFPFLAVKREEEGRGTRPVALARGDLKERILKELPEETPVAGPGRHLLREVKEGRLSMEAFVAQLSLTELEAISRGDYVMNSPLGAAGNAGVFGGVLPSLREKGIPPVTCTDGPSGIRLKTASSLIPCATLLASTFDPALVEEVYAGVGGEMRARGSDVLLAPAMNLHRDPLCGRNFEYFSEDPLLSGKIAAAAVRGVQSAGVSACPKHFACNNQEFNRNGNDSRLSERALRELYLRAFEICVREGKPQNLMTSYNKINGVWAHYHYELCRGILRGEWGYAGNVITDWWMRKKRSPEFPKLKNNAYRVRAGVNVLMPGGGYLGVRRADGSLLRSLGKRGGITLAELRRNAAEILHFVMQSPAMERDYPQKPAGA